MILKGRLEIVNYNRKDEKNYAMDVDFSFFGSSDPNEIKMYSNVNL